MIVFARGLTLGAEFNPYLAKEKRPYWLACGKALDRFNRVMAEDKRVDVVVLPAFDGVSMVKWKKNESKTNGIAEPNGHSGNEDIY